MTGEELSEGEDGNGTGVRREKGGGE